MSAEYDREIDWGPKQYEMMQEYVRSLTKSETPGVDVRFSRTEFFVRSYESTTFDFLQYTFDLYKTESEQ